MGTHKDTGLLDAFVQACLAFNTMIIICAFMPVPSCLHELVLYMIITAKRLEADLALSFLSWEITALLESITRCIRAHHHGYSAMGAPETKRVIIRSMLKEQRLLP